MKQRTTWLVAGVILIVATMARCRTIADRTLSIDEAFTWKLVSVDSAAAIVDRTAADVHPPLYYLVLKAWLLLLGDGLATLRSLSVMFGAASLVLTYAVARDSYRYAYGLSDPENERAAGIVALILAATAGTHIRWSGEARMYTLLCAVTLWSTWVLMRGVYGPARKGWSELGVWAGYATGTAALLYTHNYAVFIVGGQALWLLGIGIARRFSTTVSQATEMPAACDDRARAWRGMMALGVAGLLYLPWVPELIRQATRVRDAFWIPTQTGFELVCAWADLMVPRNRLHWGNDWTAAGLTALSLIVPTFLAYSHRKSHSLLALLLILPTFVPVGLTLYGMQIVDESTSRFWLPVLLLYSVALGVLVSRYTAASERWLFAAILVANNVYWASEFDAQIDLDFMTGVKGAAAYVQQHHVDGEPIVVREPIRFLGMQYFLRKDAATASALRLVPRPFVTFWNGGAMVTNQELCQPEELTAGKYSDVWVIDGCPLTYLMEEARLPDPWRPVDRSMVFPEPFLREGKTLVTRNRRPTAAAAAR